MSTTPIRNHPTGAAHAAPLTWLVPLDREHWTSRLLPALYASLLIAIGARIVVPIGPVPVTMQDFAVLLIAATLGLRLGAGAVGLYLAQGMAGLPVFAGGAGGALYLLGPTGGYLMGFLLAAVLVGWCADRGVTRTRLGAATTLTAGLALIFIPGLIQLSMYVPASSVLSVGLAPFIPGAIVKIALLTLLLPHARRTLGIDRR